MLVQLEREIDREVAAEQRALQRANSVATESADSDDDEDLVPLGPVPQIVTNDLKSLDEMVSHNTVLCSTARITKNVWDESDQQSHFPLISHHTNFVLSNNSRRFLQHCLE